jgi:hypothetical protein
LLSPCRISHEFTQQPDFFKTTGVIQNVTDQIPSPTDDHGAWGYNEDTSTMTYLVSGKGAELTDNNNTQPINIQFQVCFIVFEAVDDDEGDHLNNY